MNRFDSGLCVKCGDVLLSPKDSPIQMCSKCQKWAEKTAVQQIKRRKTDKTFQPKAKRMRIGLLAKAQKA